MSAFRRPAFWPCLLLVLFVDVRAGAAQPDSAVANVQHDPQRWLQALLLVEGEERVRVEVSRTLLDRGNRRDFHIRERVVLYEPVFFPDSIDYARAEVANASLRTAPVPQPLPNRQVFRLEARRNSLVMGAILGGGLLAGVGLTTGFAEACPPDASDTCLGDADMVWRGLGGAALGALVGGIIGSRIHKWKTIYTVGPVPSEGLINR